LTPDNSQAAQKGLTASSRAKRQLGAAKARCLCLIGFSSIISVENRQQFSQDLYFHEKWKIQKRNVKRP